MARIVPKLRRVLISNSNHHHHVAPPLVCPSSAVERQKKVSNFMIVDFSAYLTYFFTDIGDIWGIFGNQAGFRAPPLI